MALDDNPVFQGLDRFTKATDRLADKLTEHRKLYALHAFVTDVNKAQSEQEALAISKQHGTILALMSPEQREGVAVSSPEFGANWGRAVAAKSGKGRFSFQEAKAGGLTRAYAFDEHSGTIKPLDDLYDPLTGARMRTELLTGDLREAQAGTEKQRNLTELERTRQVHLAGDTELSRQNLLDVQAAEKGARMGNPALEKLARQMQPVQKFIPSADDPINGTMMTLYPLISKDPAEREKEVAGILAPLQGRQGVEAQLDAEAGVLRVTIQGAKDPTLSSYEQKKKIDLANDPRMHLGKGGKGGTGGTGGTGGVAGGGKLNTEDTKMYAQREQELNDAIQLYEDAVVAFKTEGTPIPPGVREGVMRARQNYNKLAQNPAIQGKYGATVRSVDADLNDVRGRHGYGGKRTSSSEAAVNDMAAPAVSNSSVKLEDPIIHGAMYEYAEMDPQFKKLWLRNSTAALKWYKKNRLAPGAKITRREAAALGPLMQKK